MTNQLEKEFNTILQRKDSLEEGSYTAYLFNKGKEKILKKVGEECTEVVIASMANNKEELIGEICDLTYCKCPEVAPLFHNSFLLLL